MLQRMEFILLVLCASLSFAGPQDSANVKRKMVELQKRAENFKEIQKKKKKLDKWKSDREKHIEDRERSNQRHNQARVNYISRKKAEIKRGDRGFSKDQSLREKELRRQNQHGKEYLALLQKLKRERKKYRREVHDLKEVGLPTDYK